MNHTANLMICAGVLLLAIQSVNARKPEVVDRIVEAAKPVVKQRLVHVIEIGPDEPPKNYVLMEPDK